MRHLGTAVVIVALFGSFLSGRAAADEAAAAKVKERVRALQNEARELSEQGREGAAQERLRAARELVDQFTRNEAAARERKASEPRKEVRGDNPLEAKLAWIEAELKFVRADIERLKERGEPKEAVARRVEQAQQLEQDLYRGRARLKSAAQERKEGDREGEKKKEVSRDGERKKEGEVKKDAPRDGEKKKDASRDGERKKEGESADVRTQLAEIRELLLGLTKEVRKLREELRR